VSHATPSTGTGAMLRSLATPLLVCLGLSDAAALHSGVSLAEGTSSPSLDCRVIVLAVLLFAVLQV
jgi:hypothetical protein